MGTAIVKEKSAASSSAPQRQSPKLSPCPIKSLKLVSKLILAISCLRFLDSNTSLTELERWHGSPNKKRALDDANALLNTVLCK